MIINGDKVMRKLALSIFLMFSLSCQEKTTENVQSISFSVFSYKNKLKSGYAVEFDNDLNIHYFGQEGCKLKGFYKGDISLKNWNNIKDNLILDSLSEHVDKYPSSTEDFYYDFCVISNKKKYYTSGYYSNTNEFTKKTCEIIFKILKNSNLVNDTTIYIFNVNAYEDLKLPPPLKKK